MTTDCFVCVEPLTVSKSVTCLACDFIACRSCTQKFILSKPAPAQCMNPECAVPWSMKFLADTFPAKWVNGTEKDSYRTHMKKIALERERSKLPQTIAQLPEYHAEERRRDRLQKEQAEIVALQQKIRKRQAAVRGLLRIEGGRATAKTLRVAHFMCPCPVENCRGLVEASTARCAVCTARICRSCRNRVGTQTEEKHVCLPEAVESVKLMRKDTKPCPTCASPIFKIDGCDQMWCTQCQTAFSWQTAKIETGIVHNPHAVRWEREHGRTTRNPGDVPCGGLVPMAYFRGLPSVAYAKVAVVHRRIAELGGPYGLLRSNTPNFNFQDLRFQYVTNKIDEKQFQQNIFLRERTSSRKKQTYDILQTLQTLGIERIADLAHVLQGLPRNPGDTPLDVQIQKNAAATQFLVRMEQVRCFINKTFQEELPLLGTPNPMQIVKDWRSTIRPPEKKKSPLKRPRAS